MGMGLSRCKLTAYQQNRLLEFFVLEVTARGAADILGIHPNSAALFYTKVRLLIAEQLALDALHLFDGCMELDESYFGGVRKGSNAADCGFRRNDGSVDVLKLELVWNSAAGAGTELFPPGGPSGAVCARCTHGAWAQRARYGAHIARLRAGMQKLHQNGTE